nr:hypothetical protein CFP56_16802 [Quercus suber]
MGWLDDVPKITRLRAGPCRRRDLASTMPLGRRDIDDRVVRGVVTTRVETNVQSHSGRARGLAERCEIARSKPQSASDLAHASQTQVDIRAPAPETLHGNTAAEILGVCPPQRQSIPQPRQTAATTRGAATDDLQPIHAAAAAAARDLVVDFVLVERREPVLPQLRVVLRADPAAAVADADRDAGGALVQRPDVGALRGLRVIRPGRMIDGALVVVRDDAGRVDARLGVLLQLRRLGLGRGRRRDRDLDRLLLLPGLDRGAEAVLQQLRQHVLEVHGDVRDVRVRAADDPHRRAHAVLELADLADRRLAAADDVRGPQRGVDDAAVRRRRLSRAAVREVAVRLRAEVQRDVLLGDQARADARAQMLVQETRDFLGRDVFACLEEAAREDGDGVVVRQHQVRHDFRELDLVLQRLDAALGPGQQRAQRVHIVAVDLADVGVRHDDVREVAQALDAVGEARGQDFEREIRAVE